jgi:hypothetical protein
VGFKTDDGKNYDPGTGLKLQFRRADGVVGLWTLVGFALYPGVSRDNKFSAIPGGLDPSTFQKCCDSLSEFCCALYNLELERKSPGNGEDPYLYYFLKPRA